MAPKKRMIDGIFQIAQNIEGANDVEKRLGNLEQRFQVLTDGLEADFKISDLINRLRDLLGDTFFIGSEEEEQDSSDRIGNEPSGPA